MNLSEREALKEFLRASAEHRSPLGAALEAFRESQARRYQADCAGYMANVPRDTERASDAAARADAYNCWWNELAAFVTEHAK